MSDFIRVETSLTGGECIFLADTQADISILKIGIITEEFEYNSNELVSIKGVTHESVCSIGTVIMDIIVENLAIEHKLHLVDDDFEIPSAGILGRDFIKKHRCSLNYETMTFEIKFGNITVSTPIYSDILENGTTVFDEGGAVCMVQKVDELNDNVNDIEDECQSQRFNDLRGLLKLPSQANKLLALCLEFNDIFHLENDQLSVNNFYEQNLIVSDEEPVFTKNYRLPYAKRRSEMSSSETSGKWTY